MADMSDADSHGFTRREATTLAAWSAPVVLLALATPSAAAASRPGPSPAEISLSWDAISLSEAGTATLIITTPDGHPYSSTTITVEPAGPSVTASYDHGTPIEFSHTDTTNGFVINQALDASSEYSIAVNIEGSARSGGTHVIATCDSVSASINYSPSPP
jgi:hypothetical protein